jgi:mycothiol system anti-sigma-R factor
MSETDCQQLLERLWAYLDGEADEGICNDFRAHFAECLPCAQRAEFERRLREVIQMKCRGERAPQTLRLELVRLLDLPY